MKAPLPFLLLLILAAHHPLSAQAQSDTLVQSQAGPTAPEGWDDLSCYQFNKLPPHTLVIPYASLDALTQLDYPHSPYYRSLNGPWHFLYYSRPDLVPDSLTSMHFSIDSLPLIQVPGNIELQGYGIPVYVNMRNDFRSQPPEIPSDYNPVGCYLRDFSLPAEWSGRRVILKFGAARSALTLYINGRYVGYSEDSKSPAEWDITRYLQAGTNRIVAKVYRWSDGSYLECQDMWRMSGITRDVALYSLPSVHIRDFRVIASLDTADYRTGRLDLTVDLSTEVTQPLQIEVELLRDGATHFKQRKALDHKDWYLIFPAKECLVGPVQSWSPEHPALYTLAIRLLDDRDSLLQLVGCQVGFRNIKIQQGQLCLNGTPLTIRGVNRHEHSGYTGQYVSRELMRTDAEMMRWMGINAVRTAHYPNDEYWYELCDQFGLLIWDEANNESHAQGYGPGSLAKNEDWAEVILYRCNNMLQRDKNHPSVIVWSLGNESGNGICYEQAYRYMKQKDATRPVFYERSELARNTDLVGIMYPSVDYLSQYARGELDSLDAAPRRRPYIIAEYCHAMGNSVGGLSDYWDTIQRYSILQGGFLWDWADQSFPLDRPDPLRPDGTPLPLHRDEEGPANWRAFQHNLQLQPPVQRWYAVGGDLGKLPGLRDDGSFCANGLVGSDRIPHPHVWEVKALYQGPLAPDTLAPIAYPIPLTSDTLADPLRIARGTQSILLHNSRLILDIDSRDGTLNQYILQGQSLLAAPLRWNFWRPPTLNDRVDPNGAPAWEGLDQLRSIPLQCTTHRTPQGGAEVQLLLQLTSSEGQQMYLRQILQASPTGALQLSYQLQPQGAWRTLPKVGIQFGLADSLLEQITYYGNRYETYPDRAQARHYALWKERAATLQAHLHVVPQESGNRQADWLTFGNDHLQLLLLHQGGEAPFQFSLRRHTDNILTHTPRRRSLPDAGHYILSVDHRIAGLGTATCGPGVRAPYQLSGDSLYTYRFSLTPIAPDSLAAAPILQPHPGQSVPLPIPESPHSPIAQLHGPQPDPRYATGYPQILYDSHTAEAGHYSQGWIGYSGTDSLLYQLTLATPQRPAEIAISFAHHPAAWVLAPKNVQVQFSADGRNWSEWKVLTPTRPLADPQSDLRHITYNYHPVKSPKVRHLRIRIQAESRLPQWHDCPGEPAWTMIDEIRITATKR